MLKFFGNFNIEQISKKMKAGFVGFLVVLAFSLIQLCSNSNYRASVKFLNENYSINAGCGKTKSVRMSTGNTKIGKYIFDVTWVYGCKHEVFVETDIKTNKVLAYKIIIDDSDRTKYYNLIRE